MPTKSPMRDAVVNRNAWSWVWVSMWMLIGIGMDFPVTALLSSSSSVMQHPRAIHKSPSFPSLLANRKSWTVTSRQAPSHRQRQRQRRRQREEVDATRLWSNPNPNEMEGNNDNDESTSTDTVNVNGSTSMSMMEPKVYPQRWVQLGYLSLLALLSDWICFSLAAAPQTFESSYPGHSAASLIDIFLFTNVASCFCEYILYRERIYIHV